ncbi:MAG: response regulator [Lachnospiraceae bacterium]|nr:response regulator [Lachnospiraceae bacterium]
MYKVIIIDDEPVIVQGLTKSIKWEQYECEVVGTASSGLEGLELMEKEQPDIVFSDIRMPHMDGLSMIAAAKSQYPDMEISILTGFQDFEYARAAIRLGVTRFLVKPSRMDELQEAVQTMADNLRAKGIAPEHERVTEVPTAEQLAALENETEADGVGMNAHMEENAESGEVTEASSFLVNNALKYMQEHYREKLKLQDVADQVYVSQWHLSKLLNRYKGQSFSDILNNIRIEKAKELLNDPSLRIGDIADMVGFLDMAHFSRVFKRQTGVSANEYRNTLK